MDTANVPMLCQKSEKHTHGFLRFHGALRKYGRIVGLGPDAPRLEALPRATIVPVFLKR